MKEVFSVTLGLYMDSNSTTTFYTIPRPCILREVTLAGKTTALDTGATFLSVNGVENAVISPTGVDTGIVAHLPIGTNNSITVRPDRRYSPGQVLYFILLATAVKCWGSCTLVFESV